MAHLLTGNKFNPEKDIPDLSGKVDKACLSIQNTLSPSIYVLTLSISVTLSPVEQRE